MIVMKFGGTSVEDAKAIDRVASIVEGRLAQKPVVVVSAMAKVTDTLLTMAKSAGAGERKTALKLCRSLQERHYNTASELLGTARFTEFHSDLGSDFETLDELLRGISAVGEITPRTTDHVAAFGEMLSSKIVAAAFAARGLNGAHIDSRDVLVTDSAYMQAVPQYEETNTRLQQKVQPLLNDGQVPVMGGFIAANRAGITTTIGRGGSPVSGSLDDSSFIQKMNQVLAHPFKVGFADAMHAVFWLGGGILVIGLVILVFLPELPLRTQSGMQARASEEAAAAAAG